MALTGTLITFAKVLKQGPCLDTTANAKGLVVGKVFEDHSVAEKRRTDYKK